jgi:hypothetical protein
MPASEISADVPEVVLRAMTASDWNEFLSTMRICFAKELDDESPSEKRKNGAQEPRMYVASNRGMAFVAPRGIGPTAWSGDDKQRTHIRRRFMLLGQTLDGMRVWDVRRAIQTLRLIPDFKSVPLTLAADDEMAGIAVYAALFEPAVGRLCVNRLSNSHREGPDFLNVLRCLDMPQAVAMVAERAHVRIETSSDSNWSYPLAVSKELGWTRKIDITSSSKESDRDDRGRER